MDHNEAQCAYCNHWYDTPVGHYHSEEECLANQKENANGSS